MRYRISLVGLFRPSAIAASSCLWVMRMPYPFTSSTAFGLIYMDAVSTFLHKFTLSLSLYIYTHIYTHNTLNARKHAQRGHTTCTFIASFPGSCAGEEEREPGTHCSRMRQVPLVTCILLRYTKITVNFCLPPERPHCMVILPVGHIRAVLKSKTISL